MGGRVGRAREGGGGFVALMIGYPIRYFFGFLCVFARVVGFWMWKR